jgi:hypothetical protein
MRIFNLTCDGCGAVYDVAESATLDGPPADFSCSVCGHALVHLHAHRFRVCRMTIPADRSHVPHEAGQRS